jgi:hypothetical protein
MKTKSTGENLRNKTIGLLGLALAGLFASGCSSLPPAWQPHPITNTSSLTGKATIVVPVQGAAIAMQNSQIGTAALFGIVGVAFKENLIDKPNRNALLAKTGGHASVFSPEVILAEECVSLLNQSGWSSGTNVTLFDGLENMPGLAPEIAGETHPFRTTFGELRTWQKAYSEWLISGPVHTFSANETGSRQLVVLEVTVVLPLLQGGDLSFGVLMRLMDPVSGQSIASGFCRRDDMTVHPFKSAADLDAFVADYRKCARQISETLLKQLNLIP